MKLLKETARSLPILQGKYALQYILPLAMTLLFLWLALSRFTYWPVDFYVYYDAAKASFNTTNIYAQNIVSERLPNGGLPFVYTPFTLLPLLPLTWLPPLLAWALWTLIMLTSLAWALRFLARSVPNSPAPWHSVRAPDRHDSDGSASCVWADQYSLGRYVSL